MPSVHVHAGVWRINNANVDLNIVSTIFLALTSVALYEKTGYLRYGMILHALYNWSGPILGMAGIELPPPVTAALFALSVVLFVIAMARKDKLLDRLAA